MIFQKNFSNWDPADIPLDTEYVQCNFSHTQPIDVGGGVYQGVRLFPGDDTPRSFTRCQLTNAEVPPGSTVVKSNQNVVQRAIVVDTETITIDGQVLEVHEYKANRYHGRYNHLTQAYEYDVPFDEPVNKERK